VPFVVAVNSVGWQLTDGTTEEQRHRVFLPFFREHDLPFFFLFSVPLRLCGLVAAMHSAGGQLTDGTTEEQRHRVFLTSFREHDPPFFFCSLCLCVSVVWWLQCIVPVAN